MNAKESEKPKGLSKEAMKELRAGEAKTREITTKTQKLLDRALPLASGQTLKIRAK